jgi:hypothetical protein
MTECALTPASPDPSFSLQHGLRRAARRGLWNVAIQVYLTAAVVNLKRLAAFLGASWRPLFWRIQLGRTCPPMQSDVRAKAGLSVGVRRIAA